MWLLTITNSKTGDDRSKPVPVRFTYATRAGLSICVDDLLIPSQKSTIIAESEKEVKEIERQYTSGLVTQGEAVPSTPMGPANSVFRATRIAGNVVAGIQITATRTRQRTPEM